MIRMIHNLYEKKINKLIKRKQLKYQKNNLSLDNIFNRLNLYCILNKYALKLTK